MFFLFVCITSQYLPYHTRVCTDIIDIIFLFLIPHPLKAELYLDTALLIKVICCKKFLGELMYSLISSQTNFQSHESCAANVIFQIK
jgi:polyferredoxin